MRVSSFPHPIHPHLHRHRQSIPFPRYCSVAAALGEWWCLCSALGSCFAKELPRAVSLELERKGKGRKRGRERARVSTNETGADRCGRGGSEVGGVFGVGGSLCGRF